jgi:predicted GIY-YIG superfamily endonuclease
MAFYAYMLECSDGSIYTGQCDNVEARLAAHQDGRFRGYTFKRRPIRLIFHEAFATREEALAAERETKGWSRQKKSALARRDWRALNELSIRRTPRRWVTERCATARPSSKPQDEREVTSAKSQPSALTGLPASHPPPPPWSPRGAARAAAPARLSSARP